MNDATAFAAHLATLVRTRGRAPRAAERIHEALTLEWAALAASDEPSFALADPTLIVGSETVELPPAWREALAPLEAALRGHDVGAIRVERSVDRRTVQAFLDALRALPASAPRDELQRWLDANGGSALRLLAPLPAPSGPDPRAPLVGVARAWSAFVAAPPEDRPVARAAAHALVARTEAAPTALPAVLAFAGSEPGLRGPCAAAWSVLLGLRLGIGRSALIDLACAAVRHAELPVDYDEASARDAVRRLLPSHPSRADTRTVATIWSLRANGPRHPHLFARLVAVARALDVTLRPEGAAPPPPEEAIARFVRDVSRQHDPALVHLAHGVVGRWPVSTSCLLDTGEIAVVCLAPSEPEHPGRPSVRIVVDRSGAPLLGDPLMNLADHDRSHTRVVATVDAARFGIDVPGAVLG